MSADQLGDNRPKLPNSSAQLTEHLRLLIDTIRGSFTDYSFEDLSYTSQPIIIPKLEDVINFFKPDRGIRWQLSGEVQDYTAWQEENFEGINDQGKRVVEGSLRADTTSSQYGTSLRTFIHDFSPDGSTMVSGVYCAVPKEVGKLRIVGKGINFFNSQGRHCVISYDRRLVRNPQSLEYTDFIRGYYKINYHVPFLKRSEEELTKTEVERAYSLTETLYAITQKPSNIDILSFMEEEEVEDEVYNSLKITLGLNEPRWYEQPIKILRLAEMAKYLEHKFRIKKGITETTYNDYRDRITAFRDHLWVSSMGFVPGGRKSKWVFDQPITTEKRSSRLDLPGCPHSDYVFKGYCPFVCYLKICPKGLGPFDPGPHNPSAPNDPRGPDPRGLIDPRGPR